MLCREHLSSELCEAVTTMFKIESICSIFSQIVHFEAGTGDLIFMVVSKSSKNGAPAGGSF